MDLPDEELVRALEARDGSLVERRFSHRATGECRYAALYEGTKCPWCQAEERRLAVGMSSAGAHNTQGEAS